jgi:hypothetical protein
MATAEEITSLRYLLGEAIPAGGTEADTLFTDAQLTVWIDEGPTLERAAFEGWRSKAAQFANLVTVTDGAASREFSDLLENARAMVTMYQRSSAGPTEGRARVGRIVRGT